MAGRRGGQELKKEEREQGKKRRRNRRNHERKGRGVREVLDRWQESCRGGAQREEQR